MSELDTFVKEARALFESCQTPAELENAKAQYLGKTGHITLMMKGLGALSVEEKKAQGALINKSKVAIEESQRLDFRFEKEVQRRVGSGRWCWGLADRLERCTQAQTRPAREQEKRARCHAGFVIQVRRVERSSFGTHCGF